MHVVVMFAKPFRMPDFFLISGLFLPLVIGRDWRTYLDRKVVHFAYFYVLWVTIQFGFKAPAFAAETSWSHAGYLYLEAFIEPFGTLWFIYLLPIFFVYFISGLAETNRAPFDVVEGESEIVAGHMVEYSGMAFAMFFLAEYANMILVSTLCVIMFLGGWLSPFAFLDFIPHFIWLFAKVFCVVSMFLWVRSTFPRYRYDQIMRLGWKIFIPVTLVWLVVVGLWIESPLSIWK